MIEASSSQTYDEVKRALVEIGLPIIESDLVEGEIFAQGIAPAPLTQKEWELVVEAENQRVKELSDGWLYLDDDPSDYVLTVKVSILGTDKKSLVVLDYVLSAPKYEAMGFKMPRVAPPQAVLIGSERFWRTLDNNLRNSSVAPVRQKRKGEAFRSA